MEAYRRRAIIGVGNVLMGDDGLGVHAARRILERELAPSVLVMDGGTEGLGLMDVIVGLERLVLIDCVRGHEVPGTVYCFDWGVMPGLGRTTSATLHDVSVADVLQHVALIAELPRTTVIGVEPESVRIRVGLSETVQSRLDRVCELALALVRD